MSEKESLSAAEQAWLKWHEGVGFDTDDDDDYIPTMSPLWRIAFEAGAKWNEAQWQGGDE